MKLKNTSQVIDEASNAKQKIQSVRDVFDAHFVRHFPAIFSAALMQASGGRMDAAEYESVLRIHLGRIEDGLQAAEYAFNEMITELDVARRAAPGAGTSNFTV